MAEKKHSAKSTVGDRYRVEFADSACRISFIEPVVLSASNHYSSIERDIERGGKISSLAVDFSSCSAYDSYCVLLISALSKYAERTKAEFKIVYADTKMADLVRRLDPGKTVAPSNAPGKTGPVEHLGEKALLFGKDAYSFVEFIGDVLLKSIRILWRPRSVRWKDFPYHFLNSGVNALPIVALIVFLIGLITGYQGALQLQQFGADIYIANLVGISITRELSPLMTAILMAGRSGSAFAAELGTMKVSEEIDALTTLGYDPTTFLVLPRVFALMLAAPFLTILADIAGILGGLIAAITTLGISISGYVNQLQLSLNYYHVFTGLGKSLIFGYLISAIGCFRGLQAGGGAESVGKFTTASVVTGVFLIILADAVFTYVFQSVGI